MSSPTADAAEKEDTPTTQRIARRFQQTGPSSAETWATLRALAAQPNIINLGQGFPDFIPLPEAVAFAKAALDQTHLNQYAAMGGLSRLKQALSNFYGPTPSRMHSIKEPTLFDPTTEITVTTSGTEAVYSTMQALINPGDTVVVFEPSFPWYIPAIRLAGGTPICIELHAPHFSLLHEQTLASLHSSFVSTPPPKLVILNTPHNPTGHVITNEELDVIEELCVQSNCLILSDEVYEKCMWEENVLCSVRHRPRLAAQTITMGSASKLLSMTGWRVGWVTGPADLVRAIKMSSGYTTFAAPTPLQDACAAVLEKALATQNVTFGGVARLFAANFKKLKSALEGIGVTVCASQGGYFLTCDVSATGLNDMEFVEHLIQTCQVAALPMRLFYSDPTVARKLVRFAICKKAETIDATVAAIESLYRGQGST